MFAKAFIGSAMHQAIRFFIFFGLLFLMSKVVISEELYKTDALLKSKIDSLYFQSAKYIENENYYKSLELLFQIIDRLKSVEDTEGQIKYYKSVVTVLIKLQNRPLTEKYLLKISELTKQTSSILPKITRDYSYGIYYYTIKKYDTARVKLYQCILHLNEIKINKETAGFFSLIGDTYVGLKKYGLARYNYQLAIDYYSNYDQKTELASTLTKLAHVHQVLGLYKTNLEFNIKALNIRKKCKSKPLLSSSLLNVGEAYWLLGMNDSARKYINLALEVALPLPGPTYIEVVYRSLRDFSASVGKDKDALKYAMICAYYKKKIDSTKLSSDYLILDANRSINEREAKNEKIRQEIMLQELQIKNKKQQTVSIELAFLGCIILVFIIDLLTRNNKKRNLELAELRDKLLIEMQENEEASKSLYQSEERHRFLAENTADVITLLDTNLQMTYISRSCIRLFGYSAHEIMKMDSILQLIEPHYQPAFNLHFIEMIQGKTPRHYSFKSLNKTGNLFWVEANIIPVLDQTKESINEIIVVMRDVTDQKVHEEKLSVNSHQKDMMLKEIHNRVKNNFAILSSLVNMVMNINQETKLATSYRDLNLRIRTMSLVHEQLYNAHEISNIALNSYLEHLCSIISSSYRTEKVNMEMDLAPCTLSIENTLPIGLIINELLINSFKYAFPGDSGGTILVKLFQAEEDKYCITVSDNGIGLPADFSMKVTKSMGTQIVNLLVQQIEGNLTVSNNNGACFQLIFPSSN